MLRREHEQVSASEQTRSSLPQERFLGRDILRQVEGGRSRKSRPHKIPPTIRNPSMNRLLDPIASPLTGNFRAVFVRENARILNNRGAFVESACAQDGKIKTP